MPLIADISTGPPRQNECRYITCQRCWIRHGSCPTTIRASSPTAATIVSALPSSVASPSPRSPSSVSTSTSTQLRMPPSTTTVSIPVIDHPLTLPAVRPAMNRLVIIR